MEVVLTSSVATGGDLVSRAAIKYCGSVAVNVSLSATTAAATLTDASGVSLFGDFSVARHVCKAGKAYGRDNADTQSLVRWHALSYQEGR